MDRNRNSQYSYFLYYVALRKESVDRNGLEVDGVSYDVWVALRKESVDRNNGRLRAVQNAQVALRKESVDRNRLTKKNRPSVGRSLSARRAWIEIFSRRLTHHLLTVALRKESVDRNANFVLNT